MEGIACRAAEGVVAAGDLDAVLDFVCAEPGDVVGVEVGAHHGGDCRDEVANAVVGHRDCRRAVGVDGVRERAGTVVGICSHDAARPGARREPAVGRVFYKKEV